jgi:hypothetical protein
VVGVTDGRISGVTVRVAEDVAVGEMKVGFGVSVTLVQADNSNTTTKILIKIFMLRDPMNF